MAKRRRFESSADFALYAGQFFRSAAIVNLGNLGIR